VILTMLSVDINSWNRVQDDFRGSDPVKTREVA